MALVAIIAIIALVVVVFLVMGGDEDSATETPAPDDTTTMRVIDADYLLG